MVTGPNREYFGSYVRRQRERVGLSQVDLSSALNRAQTWVSKMERADREGYLPPPDVLRTLSRVLDVPLANLVLAGYGMTEVDLEAATSGDPEITFHHMASLARFSAIDHRLRQGLSGCIEVTHELHLLQQEWLSQIPDARPGHPTL